MSVRLFGDWENLEEQDEPSTLMRRAGGCRRITDGAAAHGWVGGVALIFVGGWFSLL